MRRLAPLLFVLAACSDGALDLGNDASIPPDLAPPCRTSVPDKVDVLFMMDDSGGTIGPTIVRQLFPKLIQPLDDFAAQGHPASYHFGVVTSDLGAPGISCGTNRGAKLQQVGAGSAPGCLGPVGQNFLVYDQLTGENNVPMGQDLPTTFGCMASVGDKGCGFEMPLEAVYRALHDDIPENKGFLRDDALLVVLFVTDEDDCSADPTSDLFTLNPAYGNLASFRCTRFGIFCDGAMVRPTPQTYSLCAPATPAQGSKLTDLDRYIHYFTASKDQGGVKAWSRDVLLATIDAPSAPFATQEGNGPDICGQGLASCTILGHSCVESTNSSLFGDPAVRINAVVNAVGTHAVDSMCEDDWSPYLTGLAQQINAARTSDLCTP